MTTAEERYWLAQAKLLHSREEVPEDDEIEACSANREWVAIVVAAERVSV